MTSEPGSSRALAPKSNLAASPCRRPTGPRFQTCTFFFLFLRLGVMLYEVASWGRRGGQRTGMNDQRCLLLCIVLSSYPTRPKHRS